MMERTPTGIPGFDKLIQGGFPRQSAILLSGTPGTGKTLFALQFLHNGAKQGERGIYISFEENREELLEQARQFGWDLEALEEKGMLSIMCIPPEDIKRTTAKEIVSIISKNKVKRAVIDSLTTLSVNVPTRESSSEVGEYSVANFLYRFVGTLRQMKETTFLLISQASEEGRLASDSVSPFICTGIVHITFESLGSEYSRSLIVRKMRRTGNDEDIHPLEIGPHGLIVHTIE